MIFITSVALLHAAFDVASAIPAQLYARQSPVVELIGAGPNPPTYSLTPPFDGTNFTIGGSGALFPAIILSMTFFCSFVVDVYFSN